MNGADDGATFVAQLLRMAHDGFLVVSWLFTVLTVVIVGVSLYRLVPKRSADPVVPRDPSDRGRRR